MADTAVILNPGEVAAPTGGLSRAIGRRFASGLAWTALGSLIAQGGSLLCAVLVARILGKGAYGQFALILSTAAAITSVAGLGLGFTATKYVSEYRISDPGKVGRILGLSSAAAILTAAGFALALAVMAPALVLETGKTALTARGLRWSTICVYFNTVGSYQIGAMAGFEAFGTVSLICALYGLASVVLTCLLAFAWGLQGAVAAQGCGAFLLWLFYHLALRRECRVRGIKVNYGEAWSERAVLMRFSLPSAACGVVASFAVWLSNTTLVAMNGYAELGVYAALNTLRSVVLFVPALIGRVSLPMLNSLLAARQWRAYRRTFWATVAVNGSIALLLATILFAGGTRLLRLFGRDFAGTPGLFAMVLGSVVLEALAATLFQALFTSGRIWRNVAINGVWAGVLITSAMLASSRGAAGLAFSYLMASCASVSLYALAAVKQCRTGR